MKNCFTGRLGRLFLNALTLESRSPGSVVMKKRNTTDPGLRHSRMTLCDERRGGFTLIELLVVVLIIGILSAIALPQYQMAVTKSRVATMLPLMRRWYDAMAMYKIENGYYCSDRCPTSAELGVSWPPDFSCSTHGAECWNDQWSCFANEEGGGEVYCHMEWLKKTAYIQMSQPDDPNYPPGKRFCGDNEKVCKALGGKEIPGYPGYYEL